MFQDESYLPQIPEIRVTDTGWTKDLEGPFAASVSTAAAHQSGQQPFAGGVSTAAAHHSGQQPFAVGVSTAAAHQSGQQPFTGGVSAAAAHQSGQQPFAAGVNTAVAQQRGQQPFTAGGAHFLLAAHSSGGSRFATAALAFSAADFLPCDARRTTHSFVASLQSHGMLSAYI
jgi:hypothetical protein